MINSDELIRQPEGVLRALCAALGLAWDPAMLSWAAGPKPYDGCWASWWYRNTHKSVGGYCSKGPLEDSLWAALIAEGSWLWPYGLAIDTPVGRPCLDQIPAPRILPRHCTSSCVTGATAHVVRCLLRKNG